jgi:hypothetical protein
MLLRRTHASTVNVSPLSSEAESGTLTWPPAPSRRAAVLESPLIAPTLPSATPPL